MEDELHVISAGHFFLAYGDADGAGLVDAFTGCSAHTTEGCQDLLSEAFSRWGEQNAKRIHCL